MNRESHLPALREIYPDNVLRQHMNLNRALRVSYLENELGMQG